MFLALQLSEVCIRSSVRTTKFSACPCLSRNSTCFQQRTGLLSKQSCRSLIHSIRRQEQLSFSPSGLARYQISAESSSASELEALANAPRQGGSLSPKQTLQAVALPPDTVPALGPRVEHLIAQHAGTLSSILAMQLQLPEVRVQ